MVLLTSARYLIDSLDVVAPVTLFSLTTWVATVASGALLRTAVLLTTPPVMIFVVIIGRASSLEKRLFLWGLR